MATHLFLSCTRVRDFVISNPVPISSAHTRQFVNLRDFYKKRDGAPKSSHARWSTSCLVSTDDTSRSWGHHRDCTAPHPHHPDCCLYTTASTIGTPLFSKHCQPPSPRAVAVFRHATQGADAAATQRLCVCSYLHWRWRNVQGVLIVLAASVFCRGAFNSCLSAHVGVCLFVPGSFPLARNDGGKYTFEKPRAVLGGLSRGALPRQNGCG